ncbi:MAG: hypothetical protein A2Y50_07270 [Pseudomonadales bacterium RIFCSPLOWO2_12_59_9]|nr:MAG: hypothetical protein A2Y50_07270 [Pseudomonadales bacterium RIFCSPLOWO2_12_59_9]
MTEYDDLPAVQGGALAPYSPSQSLAPSPDNWGLAPDVDHITPHSGGGSLQVFGELMPPGTTIQQIEQAIGEIAGLFMSDMSRLGHPAKVINAAIEWYRQAAITPPRHEQKRHKYNFLVKPTRRQIVSAMP